MESIACPQCKSKNPVIAKFCHHCGQALDKQPSFFKRHTCTIILLSFFFLIFILPGVLFIGLIASASKEFANEVEQQEVVSGSGEHTIALVNIDGLILETTPPGGFGGFAEEVTSARRLKQTLQDISQDPQVKAVLLRINSPGGSAAAAEEIYQELKDFKTKTKLPLVVYMTDIAASGGYYIAMPSDAIIANPNTITGSIGVIMSYLNFGNLAEQYGIESIVYKTGEHKDIVSELRSPSQEEQAIIQSVIDDSFENFLAAVQEGRKLKPDKVRELADGRVYSAQQAKELYLIDGIGAFETAVARAKELAQVDNAKVIEFGKVGFWESLFESTTKRFNLSLLPASFSPFTHHTGLLYLYTP